MKNFKKVTVGLFPIIFIIGVVLFSCAGGARSGGIGFKSSYDVVVIGAGGAGLSAAVAAGQAGANVVVFEKTNRIGGNTIRAVGGLNAAGTEYQARAGITDSPDLFYRDTMTGGQHINDSALVRTFVENSATTIDWLSGMGADLSTIIRFPGASASRVHRPSSGPGTGPEIIMTLERQLTEMAIPIILEAEVTEITVRNGRVNGVELNYGNRRHTVRANAVIIATGGFGANLEMASALVPSLRGFSATNLPSSRGDGIVMAERIGAALVDMEHIMTHPTINARSGETITEGIRQNGAILVNRDGLRFVNELAAGSIVYTSILAQEGGTSFLVFDSSVRDSQPNVNLGVTMEAATPEALAVLIGATDSGAVLAETLVAYNQAVASGNDIEFGRINMVRPLNTPPFFAVEVVPAVHYTSGGVKIDTSTRVISTDGSPILGLYAAGEVTGGLHGAGRLGGNSLADVFIFGRIAGMSAASER